MQIQKSILHDMTQIQKNLKNSERNVPIPKTLEKTSVTTPTKTVQKTVKTAEEKNRIEKNSSIIPAMTDSSAEILENNISLESEISQNYLSNIQFNFKGDLKLEKLKSKNQFNKNSIIQGDVISISDDFVGIDVGYKSIAMIPKEQFVDRDGSLNTEMGKEEEIYVEYLEDSEGQIKASKRKFKIVKVWEQVQEAFKKGTTIEGTILEKIKGGMKVDVGVNAFLPDSQVDLKPILNLADVIGKTFEFKVLKCNKKRANIVISRRALLELDRMEKRAENLKKIKKGNVVKGLVKNITDYGAFLDIGGIDGLLHITDITWSRISHPSEVCAIGDTLEVMIMDFDLDQNKVSLGLKQKTKDPWENIKKYKLGEKIKGKIVNITNYGIFLELEAGIEGLVHNTELSWSKKIANITDVKQKIGDEVDVVIKEVDKDKRRISLSVRELFPNPWIEVAKNLKQGSIVEGIVQNVTEFGVFITLPQGVDGLVHISDIDWNNRQQALIDLYKKGQTIKVKVISVDAKTERLALGIKQLTNNPWIGIEKQLAAGDLVKGTVSYISDFGLFVETTEKVEGLLHINKMDSSLNSKEQLEKKYAVGDIIGVKILKIETITQKLAFILPKSKKAKSVTEKGVDATTNTSDSVAVSGTKAESIAKAEGTNLADSKPAEEKKVEGTNLADSKPAEEKKVEGTNLADSKPAEEKKADASQSPTKSEVAAEKKADALKNLV